MSEVFNTNGIEKRLPATEAEDPPLAGNTVAKKGRFIFLYRHQPLTPQTHPARQHITDIHTRQSSSWPKAPRKDTCSSQTAPHITLDKRSLQATQKRSLHTLKKRTFVIPSPTDACVYSPKADAYNPPTLSTQTDLSPCALPLFVSLYVLLSPILLPPLKCGTRALVSFRSCRERLKQKLMLPCKTDRPLVVVASTKEAIPAPSLPQHVQHVQRPPS